MNKILIIILYILGIIMIVLGLWGGNKMMLPPIVTGIGFFIIGKILNDIIRKK